KKLKLSRDTPSSILHSHLFYNLSDFYQWLLMAHSEALLYMMNNSGIMGTTIRLQQLVNADSNQMLTFYDYCVRPDIFHATKYPRWFDTLQTALLSNSSSRETIA
ncbi:4081_t:CDS:2, partial [Funneliformis geosporum]